MVTLDLDVNPNTGTVNINLLNLWPITGYQFEINFNSDLLNITGVEGLLDAQYGNNGIILGYSLTGEAIDSNPDGTKSPSLTYIRSKLIGCPS